MLNLLNRNVMWLSEVLRPLPEPGWKTPHTCVKEAPTYKLLDFSLAHEGIPTLILPPQAGGHSNIADYNPPDASLISTCLGNGRIHLYCVEYKPANCSNNQASIDELISDTFDIIQHLEGKVNIIALCQGVWQSVIYTALYPETVGELILAAGPVDFAADPNNTIYQAVQDIAPFRHAWYDVVLGLNDGVWPGELQNLGFKMMNPAKKIYKFYSDLYWNLDNEEWLSRHRRFVDWYDQRQALGAWCVDAAERLFYQNLLVKGDLVVHGRNVTLSAIACPVVILWADKDDITSPQQLRAIKGFVRDVEDIEVKNCGHIGVFNSRKSLSGYWPAALNHA